MNIEKIDDNMLTEISKMLKALSDPTRLKIMQCLHDQELCVSDIVAVVGTGQANISKHLQVLSQINLVKSRREGTTIFYSLFDCSIRSMCEGICDGYFKIIKKKYGGKL